MANSGNLLVGAVGADGEERAALARGLELLGIAARDLRLFSGRAAGTEIDVESDEAQVLLPLELGLIAELDALFFYRGDGETLSSLRGWAKKGNFWLFDLSETGNAPEVDPDWKAEELVKAGPVLGIPEVGAYWCAKLLDGLRDFDPQAAICHLFLPASKRGEAGVKELFEQSSRVMNFQMKRSDNLAFSVSPELQSKEASLAFDRTMKALAARDLPRISRVALNVPVFHMNAISLVVHLSSPAKARKTAEAVLKRAGFSVYKGSRWPAQGASMAGAAPAGKVEAEGDSLLVWLVYDNARDGRSALATRALAKLSWAGRQDLSS